MFKSQLASAVYGFIVLIGQSTALDLLRNAPTCAQNCAAFQGSNTACTPPTVSGGIDAYKGCFCGQQTAGVLADAQTLCGCTSTQDTNDLVRWFDNFCGLAPVSTTAPYTVPTGTPTSVAGPTPTGPSNTRPHKSPHGTHVPIPQQPKKESWWDGHYQWIVMVVVLLIAFSVIIALGVYYKRRYDLRQAQASPVPHGGMWGPNTSQFRSSSVYGSEEAGEPIIMQEKKSFSRPGTGYR